MGILGRIKTGAYHGCGPNPIEMLRGWEYGAFIMLASAQWTLANTWKTTY